LGFTLVAFALIAPTGSAQQRQALGHHVRFDLVQIVQGTLLAGGTDEGRDTPSGDMVELTGSGEFKPAVGDAAGGGTFIHRHANGIEVAHGVWVVTGFASWAPAGGFLPPVTDGIGEASEASAGIVTLHVQLTPSTGVSNPAQLSINCQLPGSTNPSIEEGIRLIVGGFIFEQAGGLTVFHVLE